MLAPLSFLAGAASWSAMEYALHRFVGHGPRRRAPATLLGRLTPSGFAGAFNAEHLAHHADHRYFAPTSQKAVAAAVVTTAASALGAAAFGGRRGLSFGLGLGAAYVGYELMHRRVHTRGPRNAYERWMWRHHLHHHFKSPRNNHGVTSPVLDRAFGTEVPVTERIRIPRQHAPAWLLDDQGAVRPEYEADYSVAQDPVPRRKFG